MRWRPEGWRNDSYDCSVCDTEPEWCPGCGNNAFETGADSMLESLKKQGTWLNAGQTLCDLNSVAIIPYKSKGGWLVFIKEE